MGIWYNSKSEALLHKRIQEVWRSYEDGRTTRKDKAVRLETIESSQAVPISNEGVANLQTANARIDDISNS